MGNKRKNIFVVKAAVAAIPVTCAFLLAGCQWTPFGTTTNSEGVGKEKLITDAVQKINSVQSMDTDIDAKMTAKAGVSGVSLGVDAVTDLNVRSSKKDNASHTMGNVTFELLGENGSMDIETYSLDKDNTQYTYVRQSNALSGDTGWIVVKDSKKEESNDLKSKNAATVGQISFGDLIRLYTTAKHSLEGLTIRDGTYSKDGKECYVVEGPLKGEDINAIIDGLGFDMPGVPGLPSPDLSKTDVDVTMYFEKESRDPYIIELKIPEVEAVQEDNPLTFAIDDIDATIKFNSFDANNEINVPEDVEKSAIVSVDYQELQNMLNIK